MDSRIALKIGFCFFLAVSTCFAESDQFQKNVESFIEKSVKEAVPCREYEDQLKSEMTQYQRVADPNQRKENLLKLSHYLRKYPGPSESQKKLVAYISAFSSINKKQLGWLGSRLKQMHVCSPLEVQKIARILTSQFQSGSFSDQEREELKTTLLQVAKTLAQKDGTLIHYQVSASLLKQLASNSGFRLNPQVIKNSQSFNSDLELVKQKLSQIFVGVKADEDQLFGTYFVQEIQEAERIRVSYYKKIFDTLN